MRKLVVFLAVFFFANAGFALSALPDGTWEGKGHYQSEAGQQGTYREKLTIKENTMHTDIIVGEQTFSYIMKLDFKANDFLAVSIEDKVAAATRQGRGYCASMWCHIQDNIGKFEMTIVFVDNEVYELGSDNENGKMSWFESALKKK